MYPECECQQLPGPGVFYASLPCNFYTFTHAFWMIQFEAKEKCSDYRNWRWQFYSHNPIPWVVQLISINRIWNLVIGEGFHSANKIQLCKNRWNLNAELQTWDTGGEQAARWKLGFCGIMMRNQSKSVTKKKFRQNPSSHDSSPSLSLYVFWIWQKASGNILQCVWFHLSGCIWAGLVTAVV